MTTVASVELELQLNISKLESQLQKIQNIKPIQLEVGGLSGINDVEKSLSKLSGLVITPKVNHKPLEDLNKHLDKKLVHYKQIQNYFNSNPLTIKVDNSQLNAVENQINKLINKSGNIKVNVEQSVTNKNGQSFLGGQEKNTSSSKIITSLEKIYSRLSSIERKIEGIVPMGIAAIPGQQLPLGTLVNKIGGYSMIMNQSFRPILSLLSFIGKIVVGSFLVRSAKATASVSAPVIIPQIESFIKSLKLGQTLFQEKQKQLQPSKTKEGENGSTSTNNKNTDSKSIGENLVSGLAAGFSQKFQSARSLFNQASKVILSDMKKVFKIQSPSGETKEIGENLALGEFIGYVQKLKGLPFKKETLIALGEIRNAEKEFRQKIPAISTESGLPKIDPQKTAKQVERQVTKSIKNIPSVAQFIYENISDDQKIAERKKANLTGKTKDRIEELSKEYEKSIGKVGGKVLVGVGGLSGNSLNTQTSFEKWLQSAFGKSGFQVFSQRLKESDVSAKGAKNPLVGIAETFDKFAKYNAKGEANPDAVRLAAQLLAISRKGGGKTQITAVGKGVGGNVVAEALFILEEMGYDTSKIKGKGFGTLTGLNPLKSKNFKAVINENDVVKQYGIDKQGNFNLPQFAVETIVKRGIVPVLRTVALSLVGAGPAHLAYTAVAAPIQAARSYANRVTGGVGTEESLKEILSDFDEGGNPLAKGIEQLSVFIRSEEAILEERSVNWQESTDKIASGYKSLEDIQTGNLGSTFSWVRGVTERVASLVPVFAGLTGFWTFLVTLPDQIEALGIVFAAQMQYIEAGIDVLGGTEKTLKTLTDQTAKLGLSLLMTTESYRGFLLANQSSRLFSGDQVSGLISGLSETLSNRGTPVAQHRQVFDKFQEFIGANSLTAEDLQSLENSMPGIFGAAQSASGLNRDELTSALSSGQLDAQTLIPQLIKELQRQSFGMKDAMQGTVVFSQNKLASQMEVFQKNVGTAGLPVYKFLVDLQVLGVAVTEKILVALSKVYDFLWISFGVFTVQKLIAAWQVFGRGFSDAMLSNVSITQKFSEGLKVLKINPSFITGIGRATIALKGFIQAHAGILAIATAISIASNAYSGMTKKSDEARSSVAKVSEVFPEKENKPNRNKVLGLFSDSVIGLRDNLNPFGDRNGVLEALKTVQTYTDINNKTTNIASRKSLSEVNEIIDYQLQLSKMMSISSEITNKSFAASILGNNDEKKVKKALEDIDSKLLILRTRKVQLLAKDDFEGLTQIRNDLIDVQKQRQIFIELNIPNISHAQALVDGLLDFKGKFDAAAVSSGFSGLSDLQNKYSNPKSFEANKEQFTKLEPLIADMGFGNLQQFVIASTAINVQLNKANALIDKYNELISQTIEELNNIEFKWNNIWTISRKAIYSLESSTRAAKQQINADFMSLKIGDIERQYLSEFVDIASLKQNLAIAQDEIKGYSLRINEDFSTPVKKAAESLFGMNLAEITTLPSDAISKKKELYNRDKNNPLLPQVDLLIDKLSLYSQLKQDIAQKEQELSEAQVGYFISEQNRIKEKNQLIQESIQLFVELGKVINETNISDIKEAYLTQELGKIIPIDENEKRIRDAQLAKLSADAKYLEDKTLLSGKKEGVFSLLSDAKKQPKTEIGSQLTAVVEIFNPSALLGFIEKYGKQFGSLSIVQRDLLEKTKDYFVAISSVSQSKNAVIEQQLAVREANKQKALADYELQNSAADATIKINNLNKTLAIRQLLLDKVISQKQSEISLAQIQETAAKAQISNTERLINLNNKKYSQGLLTSREYLTEQIRLQQQLGDNWDAYLQAQLATQNALRARQSELVDNEVRNIARKFELEQAYQDKLSKQLDLKVKSLDLDKQLIQAQFDLGKAQRDSVVTGLESQLNLIQKAKEAFKELATNNKLIPQWMTINRFRHFEQQQATVAYEQALIKQMNMGGVDVGLGNISYIKSLLNSPNDYNKERGQIELTKLELRFLDAQYNIENKIANQKFDSLLKEQKLAKELLEIDLQRNQLQAQQAVFAARRAELQSKSDISAAQGELRKSAQIPDPIERYRAEQDARTKLSIAEQGLGLSRLELDAAQEFLHSQQQLAGNARNAQEATQKSAVSQYQSSESARKMAQELDRARTASEGMNKETERAVRQGGFSNPEKPDVFYKADGNTIKFTGSSQKQREEYLRSVNLDIQTGMPLKYNDEIKRNNRSNRDFGESGIKSLHSKIDSINSRPSNLYVQSNNPVADAGNIYSDISRNKARSNYL